MGLVPRSCWSGQTASDATKADLCDLLDCPLLDNSLSKVAETREAETSAVRWQTEMELRTSVITHENLDKEKALAYSVATTSQKHKNFVVEPMKEKSVRDLAGIGLVLGGRLEEKGFCKAKDVLGQFLLLKQDKDAFKSWMRQVCFAGNKQSEDCYRCLREWCDAFL